MNLILINLTSNASGGLLLRGVPVASLFLSIGIFIYTVLQNRKFHQDIIRKSIVDRYFEKYDKWLEYLPVEFNPRIELNDAHKLLNLFNTIKYPPNFIREQYNLKIKEIIENIQSFYETHYRYKREKVVIYESTGQVLGATTVIRPQDFYVCDKVDRFGELEKEYNEKYKNLLACYKQFIEIVHTLYLK